MFWPIFDTFFDRDSEQFDWYQRYGGLKELLNQYVKKTDAILMAGAGNSRLSEEMVNDGYQKLMNVDVSRSWSSRWPPSTRTAWSSCSGRR